MNLRTIGAWVTAGVAWWASLGVLDVTSTTAGLIRVAMLPSLLVLGASMALAALAGWVLLPRGAAGGRTDTVLPLYALAVLVLPYVPWLPDVLPVLRVFAGPVRYFVWGIVISQVVWSGLGASRARRLAVRVRHWSGTRSFLTVFVVSVLAFGVASVVVAPSGFFPGGDEPHYLIMTQSLLADGDLAIENNHQQQDYREYYDDALEPHALARGVNGALYSVHPVGLPVLIAPAFAMGGYPAVVCFMLVLAAAAAAMAWQWIRTVTASVAAATFAWAATALTVSFFFSAGTVYPEIVAATAVMLAFSVGLGGTPAAGGRPGFACPTVWRALVVSMAAASLPWLSSKYAPMSAAIVAIGLWRCARGASDTSAARWPRFVALFVPYVASLAAWFGFFYVVWGSPWPSAAYGGAEQTQMSPANLMRGVPGLLFDQEYGLLAYAPVLAIAVLGWWRQWRAGGAARQLAIETGLTVLMLLATVSGHTMWWGGTSVPARFLVSGILLLALPVAWEYRQAATSPDRRSAYRLLLLASLAATIAVLVSPETSALANRRDGSSRLLLWLSPDWHAWAFVPDFIAQSPGWATVQTLVWVGCLGAGSLLFFVVFDRPRHLAASRIGRGLAFLRADAAFVTAVFAVTIIMPAVMGPRLKPDVSPEGRARISLIDSFDPRARPLAIAYDPFSRVDAAAVPSLFTLSARPGSRRATQPVPVLMNARFALPAGRYQVELSPLPGAAPGMAGTLGLQAGRQGSPALQWPIAMASGDNWHATFDLPVDVNYVGFQASPSLTPAIGELRLRPVRVVPTLDRTAAFNVLGTAILGDRFVFLFHDGASYPEGKGFWVRGKSRASISVVSRTGRLTHPVELRVRNGPVANVIRILTPGNITELRLGPGEIRSVQLVPTPLDDTLRMIINPETGFVPARTQPGNRDERLLGCWVDVVG